MTSQPRLTPIQSILSFSRHNGKPFPCLKVARVRPTVSGDANYKLLLSDGTSWVRAYFVNSGFDQFVEDGSIKAGIIVELRKYTQGINARGNRYLGIVWIYPHPQLGHGVGNDIGASTHQGQNQSGYKNPVEGAYLSSNNLVIKKRHHDGRDGGEDIVETEASLPASKKELPVDIVTEKKRLGDYSNKKPRTLDPGKDTPIVLTSNSNQCAQNPQGRRETGPALESARGSNIVTARQYLKSGSNSAISSSNKAKISNSFLASSSQLTEDMLNIKRTMLNDLANKHMRSANFLVVVLERRQRHDGNLLPKQDWYLWDQNSGERKTILSVWGELCEHFQPMPGTIIALWNIQINTFYEDNPNSSRLLRLATGGLGHLNAYKRQRPRFAVDPKQVVGYGELRSAWEEYRHIHKQR